ncbi:MAG TPA: BON domain-containing protein [Ramlibacter sp.]|nr:BON domain-containing protein [Ramlibacter sp.]
MKKIKNSLLLALAISALAGTLSACAPLVIGGAAVGAIMAYDRRTSGAQVEDEGIELRGASRLRESLGDRAHVNIASYNRQVLLTGEVPNEQAKQTAEQVVSRVDNVKGIVNELAVMANTTLGQRSSDTLTTGKVKASLVDDRDLYVGAFKVVTERGVVYLMGRVTQREADRATQIARRIDGVRRVVRVFDIATEEELRQQLAKPAAAPAATAQTAPAPAAAEPAPAPAVTQPAAPRSAVPTPLPPASASR